jgi:hypothetical protein
MKRSFISTGLAAKLLLLIGVTSTATDGLGLAASSSVKHKERAVATVELQSRSGNTLRYRGESVSRTFGRGTLSIRGKLEGLMLTASFTGHYRRGQIRGKARINGAPSSHGNLTLKGTVRITGGTGRYARARGRGSIKARGSFDLSRATLRQHGEVRY